jgi:hypothetical protein
VRKHAAAAAAAMDEEDHAEVLEIILEMKHEEALEVCQQEGIEVSAQDRNLPRMQALLRHFMCGAPLPPPRPSGGSGGGGSDAASAPVARTPALAPARAPVAAPPEAAAAPPPAWSSSPSPSSAAAAAAATTSSRVLQSPVGLGCTKCPWLKKENVSLLAEAQRLRHQLSLLAEGGGEVDVEALRRKLRAAREDAAELGRLRGAVQALEQAQEAAERRRGEWQQRAEARGEELAAERARLADATAQLARTLARCTGLEREVGRLRSALAQTEAAAAAAAAEVASSAESSHALQRQRS